MLLTRGFLTFRTTIQPPYSLLKMGHPLQSQVAAGEALDRLDGLGVVGRRYGYKPHISLSICSGVDLRAAAAVLRGLAESTAPFPLTLGAATTGGSGGGLFADAGGRPSLMLLPTVTAELTTLHEAAHAQLVEDPELVMTAPVVDYFPGEWLPHVTVLQEIPSLRI